MKLYGNAQNLKKLKLFRNTDQLPLSLGKVMDKSGRGG